MSWKSPHHKSGRLWVLKKILRGFLCELNYRRRSISGIEGPKPVTGLAGYISHIRPYPSVRLRNSRSSRGLTERSAPAVQHHHLTAEQLGASRISRALKFLTNLSFLQTVSAFSLHVFVHWVHCNLDLDLECICEARRLEISTGVSVLG